MKLSTVFTIFCVAFIQNCTFSQVKNQNVTCWLNIQYTDCLNNYLPCECEKVVRTYFAISIDTSLEPELHRIALLKYGQMESFYFRLKKVGIDKYEILKSENLNEKIGSISFNKDTLYFYEEDMFSKFILTGTCRRLDNTSVLIDNAKLINKAFINKGFTSLNEILTQDTLQCDCNKWIGGLNFLSIKGKPNSWVLEQVNDSLFIYKVINIESDPDDPIIKKKIYSYKWLK
jgi:hypothetical protein